MIEIIYRKVCKLLSKEKALTLLSTILKNKNNNHFQVYLF